MSFEELQTEGEVLSREDEKTRQLLGGLKRIDAPRDFDFRLKARIAVAESSDFRPRLFPILRYAAPLSLAIVVLGVLVFNGLYSFDSRTVPTVVQEFSQKPDEKENLSIGNQSQKQIAAAPNNEQKANAENSDEKENPTFAKNTELAADAEKPKNETRSVENEGVFSKNSALSSRPVYFPKGLNSNKAVETSQDFNSPTPFSVKDILSQIGVEAVYSDNKWTVVSVKQNSLAERSGVKPEDIVEAIDEYQISTETIFTKTFSGKNLNIIRDGKRLEIKLQNK